MAVDKIKSFTAALPGWRAVFTRVEDDGQISYFTQPVVGWAVVHRREGDEEYDFVQGYVVEDGSAVGTPETTPNFLGWIGPDEAPEELSWAANEYARRRTAD